MANLGKVSGDLNDRGFTFAVMQDGPDAGQRVFLHRSVLCRHPAGRGRTRNYEPRKDETLVIETMRGDKGLRAKSASCAACHEKDKQTAAAAAEWQAQSAASDARARAQAVQLGVPLDTPCPHCGWQVPNGLWRADQAACDPAQYAMSFGVLHSCVLRQVVANVLEVTGNTGRTWVILPSELQCIYGLVGAAIKQNSFDVCSSFLRPKLPFHVSEAVRTRVVLLGRLDDSLRGFVRTVGLPDLASSVEDMTDDPDHPGWAALKAAFDAFVAAKKAAETLAAAKSAEAKSVRTARTATAVMAVPSSQAAQWMRWFDGNVGNPDYFEDVTSKATRHPEVLPGQYDNGEYCAMVFPDGSVVVFDEGTMGDSFDPKGAYASIDDAMLAYTPPE